MARPLPWSKTCVALSAGHPIWLRIRSIWRVWVPETHIIVDTGPLVAFLIKEEAHHRWVSDQFQRLPAPFVTCEPVLTETFFLLRRIPDGPAKFFALLDSGLLQVDFSLLAEKDSLERLIRRYANVPMSLADACLVPTRGIESPVLRIHSGRRLSHLPSARTPGNFPLNSVTMSNPYLSSRSHQPA